MTPEEKARQLIDARLEQSGWIVQDLRNVNVLYPAEGSVISSILRDTRCLYIRSILLNCSLVA